MKPILVVAFQLFVLALVARHAWRHPSGLYRVLVLAAILGVIGLDVWYLADHAYPGGFSWS